MQPTTSIPASLGFVNASQTSTSTSATFSQASFPSVMQVSNVETYPSDFYSLDSAAAQANPAYNQSELATFRFKVNREPVSDDFWQSFEQAIGKAKFNQLYTHFLFSSWSPSKSHKSSLKTKNNDNGKVVTHLSSEIQKYNKNNIIELYDSLVKIFLYNSLKNRAFFLIYSIMETHKYCLKLNDPQIKNKDKHRITILKTKKINNLASHYDNVYDNTYKKYLNYKNKFDENKNTTDIAKLKTRIKVLRNETSKYKKGIASLGLNDLPYINHILDTLIKHQTMEYQSETFFPASYAFTQESDQPPRKKKCNYSVTTPLNSQQSGVIESVDFHRVITQSFNFFQQDAESAKTNDINHSELVNNSKFQAILNDLCSCIPSEQNHCVQNERVVRDGGNASSLSFSMVESEILQQGDIDCDSNLATLKIPSKSTKSTKCLQISRIFKDKFPQGVQNISEKQLFITSLEKITEKESFFYDQEKVLSEEANIQPEKFYNSMLMLSALNAQIVLLRLKNKTLDLITYEINKDKRGIASARRSIGRNLFTFIDNVLVHEKNLALINSEHKNILPKDISLNYLIADYFLIKSEIQNSETLLKEEQLIYNENIFSNDENIILQRFQNIINEKVSFASMAKSFPSLSSTEMRELMNDFFNISSPLNLIQTQSSGLKFTLGRNSVKESFWELLKNNISEPDFRKQYYDFIYTSWESSPSVIAQIDKDLGLYTELENNLKVREILLERCFQENLKLKAFCFIHYILKVIDNVDLLQNASDEARKKIITRTISTNIDKIINNHQQIYTLYTNYIKERNQKSISDIQAIDDEIKCNRKFIYNNRKIDDRLISKYLLILNSILKELEGKEVFDFDFNLIISMIRDHLQSGKSCKQPISTSKDHVTSCQGILKFTHLSQEEFLAHGNVINFIQQPSTSQQALDEMRNCDNLVGIQEPQEEMGMISQLDQISGLEEQIEEFLEMDENCLLNFFLPQSTSTCK